MDSIRGRAVRPGWRVAISLFVLLVCVASAAAAPVGIVKGVVHDAQHRPVPGATVTLSADGADRRQTATTDANGEFQFVGVPVGSYTVDVTLDGFEPARLAVAVVSGTTPILHVPLEVASLKQSVTVTATSAAPQAGAVTPTTVVSQKDIESTPGADRTNSLQAITAFVPGAYMTHDQLHIRGGHQVSWLIDGVPIPNTNIASNVGPQLDPKDMDALDVMRGSYDAEYGDRTYGVFNIIPRTGFERDNEAEVIASGGTFRQTNDQFNLGGHTPRFAYYGSVSGNRSDLGLGTPVADVSHDGEAGASGFGTLMFNPDAANQLRLVTSVRHDTYQIPNDPGAAAAGIADNEHESDAFLNASWVRTFPSGALLTVSPFFHWNATDYVGGPNDTPLSTTVRQSSRYVGGQATFSASTLRNEIHLGVYGFGQSDAQRFDVAFADPGTPGFSTAASPRGHEVALFAEDKLHLTSWLTATGGVRQTFFSGVIDETATSPRLGATVQVPKLGWMIRGFWGRFYQAPPLSTVSGPLLDFVQANNVGFVPLHGERDEERQIGLTVPVRGWTVDGDWFHTDATNFFDHNPIGNSNVFLPLTIDGARIQGWELTVRSPHAWHTAAVHLAYSHQHADGFGAINGGLTDFQPADGSFALDHDQRNTVSTGVDLQLPRRFFAGATAYYGSGFPNDDTGTYLPAHATLDLMAGRSMGKRWSASVTMLNVTNAHLLIDNSLTFGGTHFNDPREVYAELRYRFRY